MIEDSGAEKAYLSHLARVKWNVAKSGEGLKMGRMNWSLLTGMLALGVWPTWAWCQGGESGFSIQRAACLVEVVAGASKESRDEIQRALRPLGFELVHFYKNRHLHAIIARGEPGCVLAFRGSTTLQDWINDVRFLQMGHRATGLPGKVHRGFFKALDTQWAGMSQALRSEIALGRPLWITGHSLGGGLAHLAAIRCEHEGIPVAGVYSFAAPRMGDSASAQKARESLDGRVFRIVNGDDPVPHVPPSDKAEKEFVELLRAGRSDPRARVAAWTARSSLKIVSYSHFGELFAFDNAGRFVGKQSCSEQSDAEYWKRMHQEYGGAGWFSMVRDNSRAAQKHFLSNYVSLLRRAAKRPKGSG